MDLHVGLACHDAVRALLLSQPHGVRIQIGGLFHKRGIGRHVVGTNTRRDHLQMRQRNGVLHCVRFFVRLRLRTLDRKHRQSACQGLRASPRFVVPQRAAARYRVTLNPLDSTPPLPTRTFHTGSRPACFL